MLTFVFIPFLALLTIVAVSLQKSYTHVPRNELKRRARDGDGFADMLYRAAAYGMSMRLLLWVIIGLAAAAFFVISARTVPGWLAMLASISLLWFGFAWLPNTRVTVFSRTLVRFLTPPLTWLLRQLYPLLSHISEWVHKHSYITVHTGLYQKDDLLDLLNQQKTQHDSRLSEEELAIAANALTFGDKIIRDVLTPRRMVKTVSTVDDIGPVLMNELHESGHSRFPVYQDKPDNIVGMLYARDLATAKAGGRVCDIMHKSVHYVHEEQPLDHALQAFLKTKQHLFIVVNSFEEMVGVITIEDILEQILGKPIIDEFDKYDDLRAVAALQAKADRKKTQDDTETPTT